MSERAKLLLYVQTLNDCILLLHLRQVMLLQQQAQKSRV